MMRSLWTAASGMISQQTSVDTIANNLANVNTVGYKSESTQFKSLLYQDLQSKTTTANIEQKPVAAQVGLGTRVASITSYFSQGSLNSSDSDTDFAIVGEGFFAARNLDGETVYTRNGNLYMATAIDGMMLATADGYPILDVDDNPIILSTDYKVSELTISTDGELLYPDESNNPVPLGMKIALYQFTNPSGLDKIGGNFYKETESSGVPISEEYDEVGKKSTLKQGYLEASNVQVANEMVNLITAQRAYELCSKAITTSDTMMEQANNLKR